VGYDKLFPERYTIPPTSRAGPLPRLGKGKEACLISVLRWPDSSLPKRRKEIRSSKEKHEKHEENGELFLDFKREMMRICDPIRRPYKNL
jgi:hypothetical protein